MSPRGIFNLVYQGMMHSWSSYHISFGTAWKKDTLTWMAMAKLYGIDDYILVVYSYPDFHYEFAFYIYSDWTSMWSCKSHIDEYAFEIFFQP